ncbi:MAG: hypothetical protein E6Z15_16290 [Paenibacillus macerans]|nr:hypothetical protein [Paenibacillus macerans]
MADTLKSIYNEAFLREFGEKVHAAHAPFDPEKFVADTMDGTWDALELKARMRRISLTLANQLSLIHI